MIVKLSKSGKQVQVVDDDGWMFVTSVAWLRNLLNGKAPKGFVRLSRLPEKTSGSRWEPSPVWFPERGETVPLDESGLDLGKRVCLEGDGDSLSSANKERREVVKKFEDKEVF